MCIYLQQRRHQLHWCQQCPQLAPDRRGIPWSCHLHSIQTNVNLSNIISWQRVHQVSTSALDKYRCTIIVTLSHHSRVRATSEDDNTTSLCVDLGQSSGKQCHLLDICRLQRDTTLHQDCIHAYNKSLSNQHQHAVESELHDVYNQPLTLKLCSLAKASASYIQKNKTTKLDTSSSQVQKLNIQRTKRKDNRIRN